MDSGGVAAKLSPSGTNALPSPWGEGQGEGGLQYITYLEWLRPSTIGRVQGGNGFGAQALSSLSRIC